MRSMNKHLRFILKHFTLAKEGRKKGDMTLQPASKRAQFPSCAYSPAYAGSNPCVSMSIFSQIKAAYFSSAMHFNSEFLNQNWPTTN